MDKAREILEQMPDVKIGLDSFYGQQTVLNALNKALNIHNVIVPKGTFYCDCVQPSMQKPISETEYECFDCGKEVKQ